jgi:ubiquinone/menaquinone biosynthesis C-methylase UbiE
MSDEAAARKARTTSNFDRIAPYYDATHQAPFAHFGHRLVEAVGVTPGQRVLDVATGRGAVLFPAAERVGSTGQVIGIDLAEMMLQTASQEAARRGLTVQLRVMDAEQLDFPDASFDRVLCGFGIMFFPHLDQALAEFHRVLTPGGQLAISTWRVTPSHDLGDVLVQLGITQRGDALSFAEPATVEAPLVSAGFVAVRAWLDTVMFHYADLDAYWQRARGSVLRFALDALDGDQIARVKALLTDRVQPHWRPDGLALDATAVLAVASRPE